MLYLLLAIAIVAVILIFLMRPSTAKKRPRRKRSW